MIISTRTRYGTRALVELASAYPDRAVSVKEISQCQHLSPKYLEQILTPLKAAGIVKAIRGMHGGYTLTRAPEAIKLSEVFRVLEGAPLLLECVENPESCAIRDNCPTRDMWKEIKESIEGLLEGTTLKDLVDRNAARKSKH